MIDLHLHTVHSDGTDTVKELIKQNKITLKPNEDLILITEKNRRESMK